MPGPTERPTLADIADVVGISAAAVSLALRGSRRVSEATRARVQLAARELGYRPDPLLAALARRRVTSKEVPARAVIAVVADRPLRGGGELPWWLAGYLRGLRRVARRLGYALHTIDAARPDLAARLTASQVQGLVLLPLHGLPPQALDDVDWSSLSAVAIGGGPAEPILDRVNLDFHAIFGDLLPRLQARGLQRIGYVNELAAERRLLGAAVGAGSAWTAITPGMHWCRPLLPATGGLTAARLARWRQRERPQVVIAQEPAVLRLPVLDDLARCTLHRAAADADLAGYDRRPADRGAAALEHLHEAILSGQRGVPGRPRDIRVPACWQDGPSLPRLRIDGDGCQG